MIDMGFQALRAGLVAVLLLGSGAPPAPGRVPGRIPRVEPGFVVTLFAVLGSTGTSLDFGPDGRLYVADHAGGRVLAFDDLGGVAGPAEVFADGLSSPLGVLAAGDGAVFVADSEPTRAGPFGIRPYGRVWRLADRDGDGVSDRRTLVLGDLPNGRHNTNGMALGPDGLLYVANGSSTDDGVEGGQPEAAPWSGAVVRVDARARGLSAARLGPAALVATGMRNLYDLAFSPLRRGDLFIPTNGVDDARQGDPGPTGLEDSDDLLYVTAATRPGVDDFGFPSCLYNVARQGSLEPYDNPNPEVIERFGRCPRGVARPRASFGLHVSADGLAFQTTAAWGGDDRNDLFVAEFGNFFGSEVTGHRVVRVEFDGARRVASVSDFMVDIVPLDLTFDDRGVLYVLDYSGHIWRVTQAVELP